MEFILGVLYGKFASDHWCANGEWTTLKKGYGILPNSDGENMPKALVRLASVLFGLILGLVVIEIILNIQVAITEHYYATTQKEQGQITMPYESEFVKRLFKDDPRLGVRHASNVNLRYPFSLHSTGYLVYRTNNLGLRRDEDVSIEKPKGHFRILVLGDSMTDGVVYNNETYSQVLETALNRSSEFQGRQFQVLNAGVAGYSTFQEYLALKLDHQNLKPDLIILGLYVGNDILDLAKQRDDPMLAQIVAETIGDSHVKPSLLLTDWGARIKWYLRRNWRLYPLLWQANFTLQNIWRENVAQSSTASTLVMQGAIVDQALGQAFLAKTDPPVIQAAMQLEEIVLQRLDQLARNLSARFLVVIIPTKLRVQPEDDLERIAYWVMRFNLEEDELHFDDYVAQTLVNFCQKNQIAVLNVEPGLRQAALAGTKVYWQPNWHLNVEGNAIVAAQLFQYLQTHPQLLKSE